MRLEFKFRRSAADAVVPAKSCEVEVKLPVGRYCCASIRWTALVGLCLG